MSNEITPEIKAAQSAEDRKVVNIKSIANGYTIRIEGETWAFPNLDETLAFVRTAFLREKTMLTRKSTP